MSEPVAPQPSMRRGFAPGWVLGAMLLSFVAAFGVAYWIYARYVAFERRAARHLVEDAELAVRADLEKVALYAPFRDEVLAQLQDSKAEPRLKPRLVRLSQHTGVELGVDVREVVYSRGRRPGAWVLAVGGMFPKTGVVQGLRDLLVEEGHRPRFEAANERLYLTSGAVVQQAADSVVIVASDLPALTSALIPSQRYETLELGLGEPPLSVAFVDGSARLNAAFGADAPETLRLVLHEPGPEESVGSTRSMTALVSEVSGLPGDSIQFKVVGPSQRAAEVRVGSEHLRRVAKHWATTLRTAAFPEH